MSSSATRGAPDERAVQAMMSLLGREAVETPDGPTGRFVARPATPEQVAAALRLAGEHRLTVCPVGTPESPVAAADVVLDLSRLSAIVELNTDDMLAVVQAGVPLRALAERAGAAGLAYPPAFLACRPATVGGSLARGGGPRGLRSGPGRDYALGLCGALASGELVTAGSRAIKNATGYSLTQVLIGARGAFGVIVEATLRLVPLPAARRTFAVAFRDAPAAAQAALALGRDRLPPSHAELLDRRALDAMPGLAEAAFGSAGGALLALLEGTDESDVAARAGRLDEVARAAGSIGVVELREGAAEAAWEARRELPARLAADGSGSALAEVGLPLPAVASFVEQVPALAARRELAVSLFGGAGAGALAVAVGPGEAGSEVEAFCRELAGAVRGAGGSLHGAWGAGLGFSEWLSLAMSPAALAVFQRIRATLDPRETLQPARL